MLCMLRLSFSFSFHHRLKHYIDGLVQERRNSSALAMELRFSCTNPSIYNARLSFTAATFQHRNELLNQANSNFDISLHCSPLSTEVIRHDLNFRQKVQDTADVDSRLVQGLPFYAIDLHPADRALLWGGHAEGCLEEVRVEETHAGIFVTTLALRLGRLAVT